MATTDAAVVVIDAGPIIHLDELKCLDLLADFSPLIAADAVWDEVRKHRPLLRLEQIPGLRTVSTHAGPSDGLRILVDTLDLDAGETAALVALLSAPKLATRV